MALTDSTCVMDVEEVSRWSSLRYWQLPDVVIPEHTLHRHARRAPTCWQKPLSLTVECCVISRRFPIGWAVRRFYASCQYSSKWHIATRTGSSSASTSVSPVSITQPLLHTQLHLHNNTINMYITIFSQHNFNYILLYGMTLHVSALCVGHHQVHVCTHEITNILVTK